MFGHPEIVDATLTAARAGWRRIASSRVKHTAMISTEQIAALMDHSLKQQTFVYFRFRFAVVVAIMATSGLRKINVLRLAPYDLFFFEGQLVLFISSAKNRMHRHGSNSYRMRLSLLNQLILLAQTSYLYHGSSRFTIFRHSSKYNLRYTNEYLIFSCSMVHDECRVTK
jgi:integrase